MKELVSNIHWLGHDSFRIEGDGLVIYIDPWKLKGGPKADLILITHDHHDHCSPPDVAQVLTDDTVIVTIQAAADMLPDPVLVVKPGDELTAKGIPIKAVPAYNVNKFRSPGALFHPPEAGHVGFILTVDGRRIYHTGDTDCIPEMSSIEADIALLPVSGTYVMTAEEAVEAAAAIQPQVAIPMHVGGGIGSLADADRFKQAAAVPVVVLSLES
ncbi:MAG: MBL fold metallo-hydrolase [Ardenticatenales bacterium]|nr:MBL fold metallo-hydrolase [Ardenticatenales bacterium]